MSCTRLCVGEYSKNEGICVYGCVCMCVFMHVCMHVYLCVCVSQELFAAAFELPLNLLIIHSLTVGV